MHKLNVFFFLYHLTKHYLQELEYVVWQERAAKHQKMTFYYRLTTMMAQQAAIKLLMEPKKQYFKDSVSHFLIKLFQILHGLFFRISCFLSEVAYVHLIATVNDVIFSPSVLIVFFAIFLISRLLSVRVKHKMCF